MQAKRSGNYRKKSLRRDYFRISVGLKKSSNFRNPLELTALLRMLNPMCRGEVMNQTTVPPQPSPAGRELKVPLRAGFRGASWYLLTTHNPKDSEFRLQSVNNARETAHQLPFRIFVPYQFLQRHALGSQPPVANPQSTAEHSNQIRGALYRYVFVLAPEEELVETLRQPWNQTERRLQFFHDRQHRRVSIPADEMERFMQACADERLDFELFPSLDEVEVGEEVRLLSTPFAGHQVIILEKRRTKTGVRLTVDVQLSNTPIKVRLYDIRDEDLQYDRVSERKQQSRDSKLVTRFQRDLIDILSRRINDKETPESRRADAATLDNIYLYRNYRFTSDPLRRRFLAMMLICAHQRHDDEATAALLRSAQEELALLDARPESRAATDVRAYLHLALYLATADPQYRAAAKQYVRDHNPKSDDLRRLLSLLCRREASKIL